MIAITERVRPAQGADILPVVAPAKSGNRSLWVFAAFLAVAAILLFVALDNRRRAMTAPAVTAPRDSSAPMISAPPELGIPDQLPGDYYPSQAVPLFRVQPSSPAPAPARRPMASPMFRPSPPASVSREVPASNGATAEPYAFAPAAPVEAPRTFGAGEPSGEYQENAVSAPPGAAAQRVHASRLANPATTVPLGTVIPAVLETALDSTRPGGVRAIVSRDVRGFDGSRKLIPRGSRLYGEYTAELGMGQNRTLIRWVRLIRPDGAVIALDSPASDPLGRAGVKGKVSSNFLERFGEALLQSTVDLGVGAAARSVSGGVILAVPGAAPQVSARGGQQVQRTLKVRHGASVSVFVARDLDFTSVEQ